MKRFWTFPVVALGLTALLSGCSANAPYGRSMDKHNFVSDAHMPKTVLLIDSTTREEIIRWDVPVGKQLVVDLEHEGDWTSSLYVAEPPYKVTWAVLDAGDRYYSPMEQYTMALKGNPVYFRVYDTRNAPPAPESQAPATTAPAAEQPAATPATPQPPAEKPAKPASPADQRPDTAAPAPADQPLEHHPGQAVTAPSTQPATGQQYPLDKIIEKNKQNQSGAAIDSTPDKQPPTDKDLQPDQPR